MAWLRAVAGFQVFRGGRVWVFGDAMPPGQAVPGETLEQENRRLRRELANLQQEQAFWKKAAAYFAKESR
jgi:transposase-like protein